MFVADNVAPLVNDIFASPVGSESFTIILGAIGFAVQIYGDFSGYSDIAIGAAAIIGIKVKINFNKPYFATSPANFWNRWNISLSSWLRDYVYLPLIFYHRKSNIRIFFATMLTMVLIAIWHSAAINFLVFGLMHGLFIGIHRLLLNKFPVLRTISFFRSRLGIVVSILTTQYLVFWSLIAFRVWDWNDLIYSLQKYIFLDFQTEQTIQVILSHKTPILIIVLFFILSFISYRKENMPEILSGLKLSYWIIFLIAVISSVVFFYQGNPEAFIYFQF